MMTKGEVHEAVDRLTEDQLRPVAMLLENLLPQGQPSLWDSLKNVSGMRVPAHWPPRFVSMERIRLEGELSSDELIRDRR